MNIATPFGAVVPLDKLLAELLRMQASAQFSRAMSEASLEGRALCIFNPPLFPSSRFVLNYSDQKAPLRLVR